VRKAASIVNDAKDHFKDIIVIKHDYSISWEQKYESDELDVEAVLTRRTFGGTSHKDVFERVNEIRQLDPEAMISCFIAVTDMESDIEETQKFMPMDIPRIYIVNHNHGKYKNVTGRIIRIK
jgi:soluble P-type ATPase